MGYRSLAHAARAHIEGEVVATPAKRSLAHAARAHINGERVEEEAKPSLAHSARIQVDESEIARRKEVVTLGIRPKSLTDIASRISNGRMNETDNVGERGVVSSTDPQDAGPPQAEPEAKGKKKKAQGSDPDDPNSLAFGMGNPVDLAPTTDNPATMAANDKKDKKVVEAAGVHEEKSFPKGIHLGNYHRNIRSRVMKIMATNQNLVKQHGIIPAEPKKEEVEISEAGFDPFKAAGDLVGMALLGGHRYDRRRNYHKKNTPIKAQKAAPAPHPNDNTPLPPVPTFRPPKKPVVSLRTDGTITHITPGGKGGFKASDAIARYRERLRRGETTKKPLFGPNGDYQKRNWTESVE